MDYCGPFKINNKCLDSRNNKFQIWDCSDNLNSQKFMYDSFTKTIRPYILNGLSNLCIGSKNNLLSSSTHLEIQEYKNLPSQKFIYNPTTKRFNLENSTNTCIDLINDNKANGSGFQLFQCKTHPAQEFTTTECKSAVDPILEKILNSLKTNLSNPSNTNFVSEGIDSIGLTKMGSGILYSSLYIPVSSIYNIKIESITSNPAPFVKNISLNTSPFITPISHNTYEESISSISLSKGIHLIIIEIDSKYAGTVGIDFSIKFIDVKSGKEYNILDMYLNKVGGIPMEEWLYSSILNISNSYNSNSNIKDKYLNFLSSPANSYAKISNLALQPMNSILSKYSEYMGDCDTFLCGFNSKVKFKEIIPPSYGGASVEFSDNDIYHYEKCNKFCRNEDEVFIKWKEITKCPSSKMPASTKDKSIKYIGEDGKEITEESSIHIDNLRYYQDKDLQNVFSIWSTPEYKDFSDECYNNILSNGNILRVGGKIFSKDGLSYLEYSLSGKISLFDMGEDGAYVESSTVIRKLPAVGKVGDYMKLENGKIIIYKLSNSNGKIVETVLENIILVEDVIVNMLITSFSILLIDSNGFFINRYGLVPSDISINDEISEYKFKPPVGSLKAYEIIKTEENSLVMTKSNIELRSKEVDSAGVATVIVKFSVSIKSSEFICFNESGFYVGDGTIKSFESKASGVKLFGLYSNSIEMKNAEGWLIKYHGSNPSNLNNLSTIRKPTIQEEEDGISIVSESKKGKLVYQKDGNLVFYSNNKLLWNSNTAGTPSTHMRLDKSGEILILNGTNVVYRSNFKLSTSIFSILFVFDEWFFICNKISETDSNLYVSRLYPNSSDLMSNNMTSLISTHININYSKYPNIVLVAKDYANTGAESGSVNTEYIDFTEFLRSNNFLQCPPTEFLCNLNKTTTPDPDNVKRQHYNVEIDVSNSKWSHVKIKSLITGNAVSSTTSKFQDVNTYRYGGRQLYGYTPLISSKYLGFNSSPFIKVKFPTGSIDCIMLVKKGLDDYEVKFDEALSYINSNMTSKSQLDMLEFKDSFKKKAGTNILELDPLKLKFADLNGDFERDDDIKTDYCGVVKVSDKCLDSGNNKVQIWDCNKSIPQKYIFDFITQTLRPSQTPSMALSTKENKENAILELQNYEKKINQKFIYDSDSSQLKLVSDKKLCVELTNNTNGSTFKMATCGDSSLQKITMGSCSDVELKKILNENIKPPTVKYSITGFITELSKDKNYRDKIINNNELISPTILPMLGLDSINIFKMHSSFSMKPDTVSGFSNFNIYADNDWTTKLLIFILIIIISIVISIISKKVFTKYFDSKKINS